MKIKRLNYVYTYKSDNKVLEWLLLTRYNPVFISTKIKAKTEYIKHLYYLNQSHTEYSDVHGIISVSFPIDKLVELIIREKAKLEYYKGISQSNLNLLKQVMSQYTPQEQRQLMRYLTSNGSFVPAGDIVERLQCDLYKVVNPLKQAKIKQFQANTRTIVYEYTQEVKASLNTEKEVLTI
ncbi:pathogenicity island protein [Macrococcus animalis]|uniref:pathogenicity island protein n=1 Tax=Macrococcus animalis TaxID=3395467 RepID=UPI0039BE7765